MSRKLSYATNTKEKKNWNLWKNKKFILVRINYCDDVITNYLKITVTKEV